MPQVGIEIQQEVFERFSDLNFKSSQAIAEFIDNAIQSYLDNKSNTSFYKPGYKLKVDVNIEWKQIGNKSVPKSIRIRDNAAGIALTQFERAFETGRRPQFNEGLNEYGMGMKVAAFWLCKKWTIVSKSFAEDVERTVVFDVDTIVKERKKSLDFVEKKCSDDSSYTEVFLEDLYDKNNFSKGVSLKSIKEELSNIYRIFLRNNEIQINIDGDSLEYKDLPLLKYPYYQTPNGPSILWKKHISYSMFGKEISGFIGILETMSESKSGLVIIRRGRVIVGESRDHLYHPQCIFGSARNAHQYKRLYGEITIKGFDASFNKNGFSHLDELEVMLSEISKLLKVEGYSMIKQAKELRITAPKNHLVIWNLGNGNEPIYQNYTTGDILNKPFEPKKEGYSFVRWEPTPTSTVNSDVTYTAVWKPTEGTGSDTTGKSSSKEYTIRWVFNNGKADKIENYKEGISIQTPSNPVRDGYVFDGWTPSVIQKVSSNVTYTAKWKKEETTSSSTSFASKNFIFNDKTCKLEVVEDKYAAKLISLDMSKFSSDNIVGCTLNSEKWPGGSASLNIAKVKELMLSLAISMFEAKMNDEDTCEGLLKYLAEK